METKEQLINCIKEWIKLDNDVKRIKKELKTLTDRQKTVTNTLASTMKSNNIDCFDINGGALQYKLKKTKKPISGKQLLQTLKQYFKDDDNLATELQKYILDNREVSVKEEIQRKIDRHSEPINQT